MSGGGNFRCIRIGFGSVGIFDKRYERTILQIDGSVELGQNCLFGHGSRICVAKNASLKIGDNFVNTAKGNIVAAHQVNIGNNVITSWDSMIMDTDWHNLIDTETKTLYPLSKPISIGDNVWICARSVILKGTDIPKGCVIGACSVVSKKYNEQNMLIAGNPASIRKQNVTKYSIC